MSDLFSVSVKNEAWLPTSCRHLCGLCLSALGVNMSVTQPDLSVWMKKHEWTDLFILLLIAPLIISFRIFKHLWSWMLILDQMMVKHFPLLSVGYGSITSLQVLFLRLFNGLWSRPARRQLSRLLFWSGPDWIKQVWKLPQFYWIIQCFGVWLFILVYKLLMQEFSKNFPQIRILISLRILLFHFGLRHISALTEPEKGKLFL